MKNNKLTILGIRGVPATHGGFETFSEHLAKYLENKGWDVCVYCQEDGNGPVYETKWERITRIHIPVKSSGPLGTIIFDLRSIWHSRNTKGLHLTLGYNTAIFNIIQRFYKIVNVINMDGIEWKRQKWNKVAKFWFWINERLGCLLGTHLIADHPCIADHLAARVSREKITMIPYGALNVSKSDVSVLSQFGLKKNEYCIVVARPEPENSILEIVKAFSKKKREQTLVVLGKFCPKDNFYHKLVLEAASSEVLFPGAIYEVEKLGALRFFSRFYIHGHQVGGTNPSLVEALGAGCAVIAHNNQFNRWVSADSAFYFDDIDSLACFFDDQYHDDNYVNEKKKQAKIEFLNRFQWNSILAEYESVLLKHC